MNSAGNTGRFQRLLVTVTVVAGLLVGLVLVGRHQLATRAERVVARPDLTLEHVAAADLARHGFRLSGREPTTWQDISLRLAQDERGGLTCLRCTIEAAEVDKLLTWPAGSRRPLDIRPPEDWPWGTAGDRLQVPDWWRPASGRFRLYEQAATDTSPAVGIYACYDSAQRQLHLWQWSRHAWRPTRSSPLDHPVADGVAQSLLRPEVKAIALTHDWWQVIDQPWSALGLPASGATTVTAAFSPLKNHHRYLLAVRGIDEPQAWRLTAEQPQHPLPDDAPVPLKRWSFAMPPGGLPAWFTPGAGPRRAHTLVRIGSGRVEAGRWSAYDREAKTLFVWDWADDQTQDTEADCIR